MCNRARNLRESETLIEPFGSGWLTDKPMDTGLTLSNWFRAAAPM
jgi:hypothetical protein